MKIMGKNEGTKIEVLIKGIEGLCAVCGILKQSVDILSKQIIFLTNEQEKIKEKWKEQNDRINILREIVEAK